MTDVTAQYHPKRSYSSHVERLLEGAVVLAALATIPIVIAEEYGADDQATVIGNWLTWAVFLADYVILAILSSDRRGYLRPNWLSAAIVVLSFPLVPPLLATVRLARLLRLLRIGLLVARSIRGLRLALGRPGLLYMACISMLLIVAGGGLLTILEPDSVKGDFWTGIWWAVVTATTVGYGDVSPSSPGGRIVAVVLMLSGVGVLATLSASIAAYFVRHDVREGDTKETVDLKALAERLDRIEELLRSRDKG